MKKFGAVPLALALTLALSVGLPAMAADEWKFGIGTGFASFSLDGDIGFPLDMGGGTIFDVDLDNSDTADMLESGFGFGGYAAKGKWVIGYQLGTATLEDNDAGLKAEWDRTNVSASAGYNFAQAGNHHFGALFGFRYTEHEWNFATAMDSASFEDDWTDAVVGVTHRVPINDKWAWSNLIDAGFGGSEGSFTVASTITWRPGEHWSFSFVVKQYSVEFGETGDIADADFYLYDVDEPSVGIGFLYNW
jgi:hypothetical protein